MIRAFLDSVRPAPRLSISDWADEHRRLSRESSAEPGRWSTARAPYQREIMDAIKAGEYEAVVVKSSSQVGKTEILNNVVGYYSSQDPCPILLVQPTVEMAETWSKDRLAPMVRDTPILTGIYPDPKSRKGGNTMRHKEFPGGRITMGGANSAASLSSRPVRVILLDEVDRYPASAGNEGDPVQLAFKRSTNFWNRRHVMVSTPTVKGVSRIDQAFEQSTRDRYWVPCHVCDVFQALEWAQVKWDKSEAGENLPETAGYECEECGTRWTDAERWDNLSRGEWRAECPDARYRGFHLWEIYSPWVPVAQIVTDFLAAKKFPETLKTWTNTTLGETWEEQGDQVDPQVIYRTRREHYGDELHPDACIIVGGVDQQKDRLELEVFAASPENERWSLEYMVFYGAMTDPRRGAWKDLDDFLRGYSKQHPSGATLSIAAVGIDSQGIYTGECYQFCKPRWGRHVFAVRGKGGTGLPPVVADTVNNKERVRVFTLGVDTLKSRVYDNLYNVTEPGPGYQHFPVDRDENYFTNLCSEMLVTRYREGRPTMAFVPKHGTRQEPIDCRVYGEGALAILNPAWTVLADRLTPAAADDPPSGKAKQARRQTGRRSKRSNWVQGY